MNKTSARILSELHDAARVYDDWAVALRGRGNLHIAVMNEPFLTYILTGEKTVESRFSTHRIAPFERVASGDEVLMKAGPLVGCFVIDWVKYYDLMQAPLDGIIAHYGEQICGDTEFWRQKADKRYATLLGIRDAQRLTPTTITKADRRGWLTLAAEPSHS
jgi:ASC-1-like (ASCH) protein